MSRIPLARGLTVDLTICDDFSFQNLPELGIDENVVCFWEGEQVSFIIGIDEQKPFPTHEEHWALLTESLAKEFGHIEVSQEGEYETEKGATVSFKVFASGDDHSSMIYHLISNQREAFWVIGSPLFCSDIEAANQLMMTLMETARLK